MPVFNETRTSVRQAIGRSRGLLLDTLAVTTATPALVRAEDAVFRNAKDGRGLGLYVVSGGGSGQSRTVVSMTAHVIGTGCLFYPNLAFSPVPSTNAIIELWKGVTADDVNGFIDDSIRRAARRVLEHKEDYSIQLGDPLRHWGSFERWPLGSTSVPSGWNEESGSGSVARNAVTKYSGRYALAQTNADSNAYILETDDIRGFPELAGEVVSVRAKVYATTGARVRMNLSDGTQVFNSGFHDGNGGWDGNSGVPISIDAVTISGALTELRVQLEIQTGGVLTAYWGKVWIEHNGLVYDFDLPVAVTPATADETGFAYVSEVWLESQSRDGEFNVRIPTDFWDIDRDSSTPRIVFKRGLIDQLVRSGRQVKLIGQRPARLPAADTDNLEVDPEYVRASAAYRILDQMPWDDMDRSKRDRLSREAENLLQDITTGVYPDSVSV